MGPRDLTPLRRAASRCFSVLICDSIMERGVVGGRVAGLAGMEWWPFVCLGWMGVDSFLKSVTGFWESQEWNTDFHGFRTDGHG